MDSWNLEELANFADDPAAFGRGAAAGVSSSALPSLASLLQPLYQRADGLTFMGRAFRLHPLGGDAARGLPSLDAWNDARGWKRFEPSKVNGTFYFASNAFGDLLGLPISDQGEVCVDRIGMLWVERYEYQEAIVPWPSFLHRLITEPGFAKYFLRLDEMAWAAASLGVPEAHRCFSSNVPAVLGGSDGIDNVAIQNLAVHVSFTLQVIHQSRQATPGTQLPLVDLYDEQGRLL